MDLGLNIQLFSLFFYAVSGNLKGREIHVKLRKSGS